jgi:hypothetical protein
MAASHRLARLLHGEQTRDAADFKLLRSVVRGSRMPEDRR